VNANGYIQAALLLSASVTMLALPGLNGTSRVAALISALCAASSMVSFVITLNGRNYRLRLQKTSVGRSVSFFFRPVRMLTGILR
jgi:hypothetical protein